MPPLRSSSCGCSSPRASADDIRLAGVVGHRSAAAREEDLLDAAEPRCVVIATKLTGDQKFTVKFKRTNRGVYTAVGLFHDPPASALLMLY